MLKAHTELSGKILKLEQGGGYSAVYAHLSRILVEDGEFVKRGRKIAGIKQKSEI